MTQRFEQFGKYLLLEKLATGGMAEVFLARSIAAGGISKFVAIKRILPQYAESPEFIDMFKDEAKIAVNLNHSNIVTIYDFGVQANQFYLVMDYVEGRNLRQILNKVKKSNLRLSMDQVIYVIKETASGLDHAHRCLEGSTGKPLNITHRDMSPQNVMISFEGEIKIVDFGIAKAESQMETTRAGTLKGKFGYMSPEQAEGQVVDLRTDIFSLGIVLWELLTNDRLFIASNELNTLRKIRDCQIPSLRKINPNIPVELERITMKALARDRNLRYQTAAAMHRDLNRFLNRHYPEFSQQDFAGFIKNQFAEEIFSTRQRLVEFSKMPTGEENTVANAFIAPVAPVAPIDKSASGLQTESYVTNEPNEVSEGYTPTNTGPVPNPTNSKIIAPDSFANKYSDLEFNFQNLMPLSQPSAIVPTPPPTGNEEATQAGASQSAQRLDEKALRREMSRARAGDPSVYGLQTEEVSQPSISSRTQSRGRSRRRRSSMMPSPTFTIIVSCILTVSLYTYMAKYHTLLTLPLITTLDPYLRPFHSLVGIQDHQGNSSSTAPRAQQLPVIVPPPLPALEEIIPVQPAPEPKKVVEKIPAPLPVPQPDFDPEPLGLDEAKDSLLVTSAPSGADIFVNGRPTGAVTPSRVDVPLNREFTITLRRTGFLDYRRARLQKNQVGNRISGTLQAALVGYLDIDVVPSQNAKVYVNGRLLKGEHLPILGYAVPAETNVTIKAEDPLTRQSTQQQIKVLKDRRIQVLLDLRRSGSKNDRQPSRNNP